MSQQAERTSRGLKLLDEGFQLAIDQRIDDARDIKVTLMDQGFYSLAGTLEAYIQEAECAAEQAEVDIGTDGECECEEETSYYPYSTDQF